MRVLGNHHSLPWAFLFKFSRPRHPMRCGASGTAGPRENFRFLRASSKNLLTSFADFLFSTCTFLMCFRSLRSRYVRKICSLRSQIFRFLHASSVSAFVHFVRGMFTKSAHLFTDFPFSECIFRKSVRFAKIRFLRNKPSGIVFPFRNSLPARSRLFRRLPAHISVRAPGARHPPPPFDSKTRRPFFPYL